MMLLSSASDPKWRSELLITPLLRFDKSIGDVHLGDLEFSVYYSIGFARKESLSQEAHSDGLT